jgi:hypothetical protein
VAQLFEAALVLGLGAMLAYLQAPYLAHVLGGAHGAISALQLGEFGQSLLRASYTSYSLARPVQLRVALDGALSLICEGQTLSVVSGGSQLKLTSELTFEPCHLELKGGDCLLISSTQSGVSLSRC